MNRKTYIHEQLKKVYSRAIGIYNDLGGAATEFYIRSCIARFEAFLTSSSHLLADWSVEEGDKLRDMLSLVAASQPVNQKDILHQNLSPKMQYLIDLLLAEWREGFTGIVFVEQRATVAAMDHVLSNHPQLRDLFNIGTFVGTSVTVRRKSHLGIGDLVEVRHQQQTLDEFRDGKKNLIVATSVLEEGIDVSNCHIVICFEPPKNLKSFIQRRGRARKQDSKFVIMLSDDSSLAQSPDKWLDLEEQMKKAYLNDLRQIQAAEAREQIEEGGDAIYRCESTGALLTLENAMQHLYHFCAILGGGQHVDLRPRFSFMVDENDLTTAVVTLPTSVNAKLRQHRGKGAWLTERAARRDAAFQAYVALHKAGLVNDNLLPLLSDPEEEPDFGIIDKRPSMLQVDLRLDPWVAIAKLISDTATPKLWYRTKLSFSPNEQPISLVLLLPTLTLKIPDFLLHWNEDTRYVLTSEPMGVVKLSHDEVAALQKFTRAFLHSVFRSRMTEERYDFLFLLGPYDASGNGNYTPANFNNKRSALEVYAELQAGLNPTIGLVRQRGDEGQLLVYRGFKTVDVDMMADGDPDNGRESLVNIVLSPFPKRRDFLHYIRDVSQHRMYSKEYILPAKDFVIDGSPASYAKFAAFIPSIIHRYELFMIVQELCNTAIKDVDFENYEMVLRAITASSTNENDYQRLEFLGDCILKFNTAVQLMAGNLHWPESYLTEKKDRVVSNGSLAKASRRAGLDRFIITRAFTGAKWRPRYVNDVLALAAIELPEKRDLSSKTLADVVESLIGAAYIEGGMPKANLCIATLLPKLSWCPLDESRHILAKHAAEDHISAPPIHLERAEELIGYTFKNKYLLLEALTHPSFTSYRDATTSSYQRLEFLGDAVLDYLISRRLHAYRKPLSADSTSQKNPPPRGYAPDELPHGSMHATRAALVNASFLGFLCMEACVEVPRTDVVFTKSNCGDHSPTPSPVPAPPSRKALWQFMRHSAPTILAAASAASTRHKEHRAEIWEALQIAQRYPWHLFARIGAEKFFSDVIEAVLGAVFVDSTDEQGEVEACEGFLERLGLTGVLERFLKDGVDCLHPKTRLGRLAFSEKVIWEWDGGEREEEGGGGDKLEGVVRCRVGVGESWIGGWVEGKSRVEAETEAADRAVMILLAEGRKWKGMDEVNGAGGEREGRDGKTSVVDVGGNEEDEEEEGDGQTVAGTDVTNEDMIMRNA
ncbi:Ribonuclease III [Macrophomina phaseolina MS6]|uniref:Ribonuclease III n=1 Tax=Macrophomina phaseolina (strain MS6) TaxID=1126212 RepID=K2RLM8_MACPH|nr:Ribonuclease III [Macrophomina phaseolina MS6]